MAKQTATPTQLTLVFINFLLFGLGLTALVVGGWVLIYREEVRVLTLIEVSTGELCLLQNAAILLITSGVVITVLGCVGCCASCKSSKCLRIVYVALVSLCCVISVAACTVAFLYRDQLEDKLLSHLQTQLNTEYQGYSSSTVDFSMAWDYAQVEFQCCGIQSYTDFEQALNWTVRNSAVVPTTCCRLSDRDAYLDDRFLLLEDSACVRFPNSTNSNIDQSCYDPLKTWMEEEVYVMAGICVVTILLQVLAILFTIAVMRNPGKNTDYLYRDANPW